MAFGGKGADRVGLVANVDSRNPQIQIAYRKPVRPESILFSNDNPVNGTSATISELMSGR